MSNNISTERKTLHYIGLALIAFGFILFISSFFVPNTPSFSMEMPAFFKRGLIGMICMVVGSVFMTIGARGAAGAGIILNPEKAREDLKPFHAAEGEMINDVLENIEAIQSITKKFTEPTTSNEKPIKEVIKIRCKECSVLNEEDAKFCKGCGKNI